MWVCLHCTIGMPHVQWALLSYNLSLKVDLLIQIFLVITVVPDEFMYIYVYMYDMYMYVYEDIIIIR